ncbi:MAG: large conductance mechanosensitive channel protein MscL [Fimbriimonadaceae bacterium]|nr:large conductance mechanosensitive channel protein MscL [Fimbriimonadaceae bacterium]
MLKEFKEFAIKGNMVDLAIGVIIGGVFGAVVSSLVADIISPLIGLLFNGDFSNQFAVLKEGAAPGPYLTLAAAQEAGAVVLSYGVFINALIKFLITAFALFLVVKAMNRMKKKEEEAPAAPSDEVVLLTEIRDALKSGNS